MQIVEFSYLSFDTGLTSEIAITTTFSRKKLIIAIYINWMSRLQQPYFDFARSTILYYVSKKVFLLNGLFKYFSIIQFPENGPSFLKVLARPCRQPQIMASTPAQMKTKIQYPKGKEGALTINLHFGIFDFSHFYHKNGRGAQQIE